jgi:hypothetical protein
MVLELPDDAVWLAAWARVSLRHAHLDYSLQMAIRTLADLEIDEARDATARDGSAMLRRRIKKLARERLGEGAPLLKLQAILNRCGRLTARRNRLVHGIVAQSWDGSKTLMRDHGPDWQALPTIQELDTLANAITAITTELNHARLGGFLAEALDA